MSVEEIKALMSDPLVVACTWLLAPVLLVGIALAAVNELRRSGPARRKDDPQTARNLRNAALMDAFRNGDGRKGREETHKLNVTRILERVD